MLRMFSGKTSDVFTFYVAWGCEKATLNPIWLVRLKRISRNVIWIGFQTTYECSSKRICTNRISCSSLPFRLFKYDRISIGFAQKSDLGWQSERGLGAAFGAVKIAVSTVTLYTKQHCAPQELLYQALQAWWNENETNHRRLASRKGGVWKNESLNESFGSRWTSKV